MLLTKINVVRGASIRVFYTAVFLVAAASIGQTNCAGGGGGVGVNSTSTCLGCHNGGTAQDMRGVLISAHAAVGCTTCHGDATAHVQSGGQNGFLLNPAVGPFVRSYASCVQCHRDTVDEFRMSGHATTQTVSCHDCHNVHTPTETRLPTDNNTLCQSCHSFLGFGTDAAIEMHTMHSVDPSGTGASRCTECHLPPLERFNQAIGPHDHTLRGIQPQASIDAINNGVMPTPPNSCAGVVGCHDGTILTAPMFNVDNAVQGVVLQGLFESWFLTP